MKKFSAYLVLLLSALSGWRTAAILWRLLDDSHKAMAVFGGFVTGSAPVIWLLVCFAGRSEKQDNFASAMWYASLLMAAGALIADALHLAVGAQMALTVTTLYTLVQIVAAAVYLRLGRPPSPIHN